MTGILRNQAKSKIDTAIPDWPVRIVIFLGGTVVVSFWAVVAVYLNGWGDGESATSEPARVVEVLRDVQEAEATWAYTEVGLAELARTKKSVAEAMGLERISRTSYSAEMSKREAFVERLWQPQETTSANVDMARALEFWRLDDWVSVRTAEVGDPTSALEIPLPYERDWVLHAGEFMKCKDPAPRALDSGDKKEPCLALALQLVSKGDLARKHTAVLRGSTPNTIVVEGARGEQVVVTLAALAPKFEEAEAKSALLERYGRMVRQALDSEQSPSPPKRTRDARRLIVSSFLLSSAEPTP